MPDGIYRCQSQALIRDNKRANVSDGLPYLALRTKEGRSTKRPEQSSKPKTLLTP